ncbi:hypothetical protein IGJ83_003179 [Enterococcus pernyi]
MYYKLEYDKVMVVDPFYYEEKNTWVNGLSLLLRFDPIFEIDSRNKSKEQTLQLSNERAYLPNLVRVSYDKKKKIVSFHEHEEIKGKYKIVSYYMDTCPKPRPSIYDKKEPTEEEKRKLEESIYKLMDDLDKGIHYESEYGSLEISKEEFYFIVKKYGQFIVDDYSLQNCSYGWHEIEILPEGVVVQNSQPKYSNEMIRRLEEILLEVKQRHEQILSTKTSAMKIEYRKECLTFMNQTECLENQIEFLLNQELFDQEKVMESYIQLINEWEHFNRFLTQDGLYTS